MSDQSTEELQAQAQAMLVYLNTALGEAVARVANLVGEKAVSDFRLKNALARIAELEKPISQEPPAPEGEQSA